jgi:diguanylate cyclase (GGDEF)-like protein/PAS domain S-box-containing protein
MGKVFANPARRRSLAYAALVLGLLAARVPLGRIAWVGDALLHTLLETTATLLSFIVGTMALVRYYTQRNTSYLFWGSGFIGAGLLDGYHTVVTSSLCPGCTPSSLATLIPWTGVISRLFLSVLMCASLLVWRKEASCPEKHRDRERTVCLLVAGWTLTSFTFFLCVPLPQAYQPQWPVHRPAELIAGIFFAIATLGYLRKGNWKTDGFNHSLILFLITGALTHLVYMPFSGQLFDALYVIAHLLKIIGYTLVLIGLFHSMFSIFRHEVEVVGSLTRANESYATEVEERQQAELALQAARDHLEARVVARTADLAEQGALAALASEIAILLTQGDTVPATLQRSSELIRLFLDAAFVRVWTLNKDQKVLELQASAGMYTHRNGPHGRVQVGQYKIGRIAQEGKPHLTNNVCGDSWVSDPEWAKREGMVAFAGYPLIIEEQVVGVVAAFARHPLSKAAYQAFGALAGTIAQFMRRKEIEAALVDSEERVRLLLDSTAEAVYGIDLKGNCTFANRACLLMLGYQDAGELLGKNMHGEMHHSRADKSPYPVTECNILQAFQRGEGTHVDDEVLWRSDGTSFAAEYWSYPMRKSGEIVGAVVTFLDITERKKAEEAISQLATIVQCSEDAIIGTSLTGTITTWNGGAERLLGYTADEALGAPLSTLLPRADQAWDILDPSTRGAVSRLDEAVFVRKDGAEIPVSLTVSPIRTTSGEIAGAATIARDIRARKNAEVELAHQARHDHLTGLPNPLLLADRLASSIQRAYHNGLMTAVIYVDLDGFKFVNDTLGHEAGDALLKQVTGRLQACIREPDTLARMGGDEFMVVVGEVKDEKAAYSIAERFRTALHRPFQVADHELYITASLGIAICPRDGTDVSTLRRNADAAMYEAKRSGKDRVLAFAPAMRETFLEHLELETELRRALDHGHQLSLVYQPIFKAEGGGQIAFEALLRWAHPVLGHIPPAKFVPVAEESGLIFRLGAWVLKQACCQCRLWQDHGWAGIRVAVNVSALQFAQPEFASNFLEILAESGLPGGLLDLEVTETTLMRDMDEAMRKMSLLRSRGIRISIDDFGTGYSSLGYLPRLPVDALKIDRSFVTDLGVNGTARSLIEGMISLGHSIGKRIVVEGVETSEQLEILRNIGCDEIQGFLLGRPAALPQWGVPMLESIGSGTPAGEPSEPLEIPA